MHRRLPIERWVGVRRLTAAVDGEEGLRVGGGGVPVVRGGGGDVGVMRRSEAEAVVELFNVRDGADVEGEAKQSPVLCSSGGWRTSSGSSLLWVRERQAM